MSDPILNICRHYEHRLARFRKPLYSDTEKSIVFAFVTLLLFIAACST